MMDWNLISWKSFVSMNFEIRKWKLFRKNLDLCERRISLNKQIMFDHLFCNMRRRPVFPVHTDWKLFGFPFNAFSYMLLWFLFEFQGSFSVLCLFCISFNFSSFTETVLRDRFFCCCKPFSCESLSLLFLEDEMVDTWAL
jgi:hypothetical protein